MTSLEGTTERTTLIGLIRWVGTLGGALVGLGALAFSAGFLAQRAQYDYAQVPFVFVDYWSYAETGAMSMLSSLYTLLQNGPGVVGLVVVSLLIVLSLEIERVRTAITRAELLLLASVVVTCWAAVVVRQQLHIHDLRRFSVANQANYSYHDESIPSPGSKGSLIPVVFPFSVGMPAPASPSHVSDRFPGSSVEAWDLLASELKRGLEEKGNHLHVRPRPEWSVVPAPLSAMREGKPISRSNDEVTAFSGMPIDRMDLEESRARELYSRIVFGLVVALWGLVVIVKWERAVRRGLNAPMVAGGRVGRLLLRWREEIWFGARWVVMPIAMALIAGGVLLASEGYGVLAMPYLGQEHVDVGLVARQATSPPSSPATSEGTLSARVASDDSTASIAYESGIDAASKYLRVELDEQEDLSRAWRRSIDVLEQLSSVEGTGRLRELAEYGAIVAPDLAPYAQDAWNRSAERTSSSRSGYILYYPRSETDYLRLLTRNPASHSSRWVIHPVETASITQVRVKGDQKTLQLMDALKSLRFMDPNERLSGLNKIRRLGHERSLEVFMAGVLDPAATVHGPCITLTGMFAAALPSDAAGVYRRQRAVRLLLRVMNDRQTRMDVRGTAATSLHVMLRNASSEEQAETCRELCKLMLDEKLADEDWELRGTAITSLGLMRCVEAEGALLPLLSDPLVPPNVRATLPSVLAKLGRAETSVPELANALLSGNLPPETAGTTIGALAVLPQSDNSVAVRALTSYIESPSRGGGSLEIAVQLRRYSVMALGVLGDRSTLDLLHRLARRSTEADEETRALAIKAIDEMDSPRSQHVLIAIAEDDGETARVRCMAVAGCGSAQGATAEIVQRLDGLFDSAGARLKACILGALQDRAEAGSGQAKLVLQRRLSEALGSFQ